MTDRTFPIQTRRGNAPHPTRIPWSVADLAYSVYAGRCGRDQSLEELARRGGFSAGEMDEFLPGWRDRCNEIERLRLDVVALTRQEHELRLALLGCDCEKEELRAVLSRAVAVLRRVRDECVSDAGSDNPQFHEPGSSLMAAVYGVIYDTDPSDPDDPDLLAMQAASVALDGQKGGA